MKTIIILFVSLFTFSAFGKLPEERSYIITKSDTIFCKAVKPGSFFTTCILDDGKMLTFKNEDVVRYQDNMVIYKSRVISLDRNTSIFLGFAKVVEKDKKVEGSFNALSLNVPVNSENTVIVCSEKLNYRNILRKKN